MSDKDKIRQEIERRKGYISVTHFAEELLTFIDSLQEEKPSEDLEEAAEEYAYRGIPDEMKSYVKPVADEIIKNFIAGAKWQAKQLLKGSPLPEDTVLFQKGVAEGRRLEREDNHFKPTQEQLDALDTVYKTHGADSACRHILLNLLNQLKELS